MQDGDEAITLSGFVSPSACNTENGDVTIIGVGENGSGVLDALLKNDFLQDLQPYSYVLIPVTSSRKNSRDLRVECASINRDGTNSPAEESVDTVSQFRARFPILSRLFKRETAGDESPEPDDCPRSGGNDGRNDERKDGRNDGRNIRDHESPVEDWLDRTLLVRNHAFTRLRSLDPSLVRIGMEIVENSNSLIIVSDLREDSLDICLLLDALCVREGKRDLFFLIQSESYRDIWTVQYLNKCIQEVAMCANSVIMVPPVSDENMEAAAEVLSALHNLIDHTGTVNIDLADIKHIAGFGNIGMMALGKGTGEARTEQAVKSCLSHPMLDIDLEGIERAIVCVNGGEDMTIEEAESASYYISKKIREGAKIIWGAHVSLELNDRLEVVLLVGLTPHQALLHHYAGT